MKYRVGDQFKTTVFWGKRFPEAIITVIAIDSDNPDPYTCSWTDTSSLFHYSEYTLDTGLILLEHLRVKRIIEHYEKI